jgi:hypothetical protein
MKPIFLRSSILSFVLGMIIIFGSIPLGNASHEGSNVSKVYHMPENPNLGNSVEVVIQLQNVSDISSVQIFTCSMEPVFCFYADNMDYIGNNTFKSIIEYQRLDFKTGTVLGYNFKIKYSDNTTQEFPNGLNLDGHDNILEVTEGVYYFTFTLGGNDVVRNDKNDNISLTAIFMVTVLISLALIAVVIALFLRRSKHINEQQSKKDGNH